MLLGPRWGLRVPHYPTRQRPPPPPRVVATLEHPGHRVAVAFAPHRSARTPWRRRATRLHVHGVL